MTSGQPDVEEAASAGAGWWVNLGAGRLEDYPPAHLAQFNDPRWIHLGDEKGKTLRQPWTKFRRRVRNVLWGLPSSWRPEEAYQGRKFTGWFWEPGESIPLPTGSASFVYAEHFLEHVKPTDALPLLVEVRRILAPGGRFRIVVPDADLAPDPEPRGYPGRRVAWESPIKHKARYSIYSLSWLLQLSGYSVVPIRYHDYRGILSTTSEVGDPSLAIVRRLNSLIVDAVREDDRPVSRAGEYADLPRPND